MIEKCRASRWPDDADERIVEMRSAGFGWREIAASFGVERSTVYQRARARGLVTCQTIKRSAAEEDAIIRADYVAHVDIYETAAKLGRSWGVVRQRLYHHHHDLLNGARTPRGTKALKKYGRGLLSHGATPTEAIDAMRAKIIEAKAAARRAAISAKENRANQAINSMLGQIASGKPRDVAIFEARAFGLSLERIASCFDITRERIRQICDKQAFNMAVNEHGAVHVRRDVPDVATKALHS